MGADGAYSYGVDKADTAVTALNSGQTLDDTFAYTVSDGQGGSAQAQLRVTVDGVTQSSVNSQPVAAFAMFSVPNLSSGQTGNLLAGASDADIFDGSTSGQTLSVVLGSVASGYSLGSGSYAGTTRDIAGSYGVLHVGADGVFNYALNQANATVASLPSFGHVSDVFTYKIADGAGGNSSASVVFEVKNSPFRLQASVAGEYELLLNGQFNETVTLPVNQSVVWSPEFDVTAGDFVLTLVNTVEGGPAGVLSIDGGAHAFSQITLHVVNVANLPASLAEAGSASDYYIVADARAAITTADSAGGLLDTLFTAGKVIAAAVNEAWPGGGAFESVGLSKIPIVEYFGDIWLPSSTRTIDEDLNNSGRLIAFNGTGINIDPSSSNASRIGVQVDDHAGVGFAEGKLTVSIDNRLGIGGVAGEILFIKSGVFGVDAAGNVFYRQGSVLSGTDGYVKNGVTYNAADVISLDANPADDARIGSLDFDPVSGGLLDGRQGRALSISFTEFATADVVQLLANQIVFGIRLADGSTTQAWGAFANAPPPSVTMTLTDQQATTSFASRAISIVSYNDTPVAHNDLAAIGKGNTGLTGWVLGNDDADILPNQGSSSTYLPTGLAVTDLWTGSATHGTLGASLAGSYGSLILNSDGTYSYSLNTNNTSVKALTSASNPLIDVFHYTMTDGAASSSADLKIMIDGLGSHWGSESKTASNSTPAADAIYKYAASGDVRYVFGFGESDVLGAVGPGKVYVNGGGGDDVMFALAKNTTLVGGAGADKFVIGSADVNVRIEDMDIVVDRSTTDSSKDILDLSILVKDMSQTQIDTFLASHVSEVTDTATGKVSTVIDFNGLGGATHDGSLTLVGLTNAQSYENMQASTTALAGVNYTLLDELKLIAANHG